MTCFREASTGESAVYWTKYLTKLPKFSVLDITNNQQTYGKEKAENRSYELTEVMSSIIVLLLHHFSASVFLCLNIKSRFH